MKVPFFCAALMASALATLPARADSPEHFVRHAIKGDSSEIMLGRIAERRGEMRGVREYGWTLQSDHRTALRQVIDTARRMHVGFDRDVTDEARSEADRLRGMRGRAFDHEFVRYMVDDHRKDIADFKDEAREHNGPASRLAERQLPTLQKHLDIALSLQGRMDNGRYADGRDHRWNHHER